MIKKKKQVVQDVVLLVVSVGVAIFIAEADLAQKFVALFGSLPIVAAFVAGIFFTSVFTTAPAIALLGEMAERANLPMLAVAGALGAVLGDLVIYKFVKDRVSEDFAYLLSVSKRQRFPHIFKTRLFKFFVPFLGALIIASPFPDEIGIALLGISKLESKSFFIISFLANGLGILMIGLLARAI